MPTGKLEISLVMVKLNFGPEGYFVTIGTFITPEVLYIDFIFMNVFMAVNAALFQILKNPFRALFVAAEAGCRKVRSGKRIRGLVVPFDGKCRRGKAGHGMAILAVA